MSTGAGCDLSTPSSLAYSIIVYHQVNMGVSHQPYLCRQTMRWPMIGDTRDIKSFLSYPCQRFLRHGHELCSQGLPHAESHESLGVQERGMGTVALANPTLGDHVADHLTSQSGTFADLQYNLGESLHRSYRLILSKMRWTCF